MSKLGAAAAVAAGVVVVAVVGLLTAANRPAPRPEPTRAGMPLTTFPAGSERAVAACRAALGAQDEAPIDRPAVLRVEPDEAFPESWHVSGDTGVGSPYYAGDFQSWDCSATSEGDVVGFVLPQ